MSESGRPPGSGAESGPRRWLFWLLVPTLVVLVVLGLRRLQSMRTHYVPEPAPRPDGERGARVGAAKPTGAGPVTAPRSPGPEPIDLVEVPCLVGEPRELQEEALTQADLRVGFTLTRLVKGEGGLVVECQPAKGTKVPAGSRVDLVVSVAGDELADVTGLTAGAARGRLVRAGFQVRRRRTAAPEGVAVGTVVQQEPAPGKLVPLGSAVTLRVAAEAKPGEAARDETLPDEADEAGPQS